MPCDQISILSLEFKPKNENILREAIGKMVGWSILSSNAEKGEYLISAAGSAIQIRDGKATGNAYQVNQLRQSYSQAAITNGQQWAKSQGWTTQKLSNNKIRVFRSK